MNSHDTSPVDNNPAAPLDEPVFLSGGKLEDALGYGPVRIQVSGTPFKVDKDNAVIRVRLTVDDSGSLMLCHQESGQVFDCSAVLPPGEWPQLDNAMRQWLAADNFTADGQQRRTLESFR